MYLAVINFGSSSIKLDLIDRASQANLQSLNCNYQTDPKTQLSKLLDKLDPKLKQQISLVAHRVVHSGPNLKKLALVTPELIQELKSYEALAPIHTPYNLLGIQTAMQVLKVDHYAVFDTGYYMDLQPKVYTYAIDKKIADKHHIRKYGFHGLAHASLFKQACQQINIDPQKANIITAQLGNGCSVTLHKNGKVIDTSMGFSPTAGLCMSSRSGNIDPGILSYLQTAEANLDIQEFVNQKAGLLGISQISSSLKEVREHMGTNPDAKLAYEHFIYKAALQISSYAGLLPTLHAVVFGGGISSNAPEITYDIMRLIPGVSFPHHIVCTTQESQVISQLINDFLT